MGNCLVQENKIVKVMKLDGKILEYHQTPLKVQQVLSEFPNHTISDTLPSRRHLDPNTDMLSGRLYYLLPPAKAACGGIVESNKKEDQKQGDSRVVRIKIVLTKQELKEMLTKGGVTSVDEMMSQLQNKQSKDDAVEDDNRNCSGWKPVLTSIQE